jgi:hypothetical protein
MEKSKKAALIIGGLAAGSTLVLALTRKAKAAPPPPPSGLANLYGTVTDAHTGKAIPGVSVSLNQWTTVTDNNGYYEFIEIQPGAYTIRFSKEGYQAGVY